MQEFVQAAYIVEIGFNFLCRYFSYITHFLSPYAKVIAVLIRNNIFLQKYQNSNFQIFPKSWLREVHACQRILNFEIFIIFLYLLDVFL
jgi:hypothetical protein